MSIQVSTFNDKEIKKLIAEAHPELRAYIKALEDSNENWKRINAEAMRKIFQLKGRVQ